MVLLPLQSLLLLWLNCGWASFAVYDGVLAGYPTVIPSVAYNHSRNPFCSENTSHVFCTDLPFTGTQGCSPLLGHPCSFENLTDVDLATLNILGIAFTRSGSDPFPLTSVQLEPMSAEAFVAQQQLFYRTQVLTLPRFTLVSGPVNCVTQPTIPCTLFIQCWVPSTAGLPTVPLSSSSSSSEADSDSSRFYCCEIHQAIDTNVASIRVSCITIPSFSSENIVLLDRGCSAETALVAVCSSSFYSNATAVVSTAYLCDTWCRWPCASTPLIAACIPLPPEASSSNQAINIPVRQCIPAAHTSLCTRDLTQHPQTYLGCAQDETVVGLSVAQEEPRDYSRIWRSDACKLGDVGCFNVVCRCLGDTGCVGHPFCNLHGILYEQLAADGFDVLDPDSVDAAGGKAFCHSDAGYSGVFSEKRRSSTASCNMGQELPF